MIRRSAASSAGVHAANDRCFSASTSDAIQPRTGFSSSSARARLGGRHDQRRLGLGAALALQLSRPGGRGALGQEVRRNTRS